MRMRGRSIKTIAAELRVSRASVSVWCRDIVLTPEQVEALNEQAVRGGYAGRMAGAAMNREKRLETVRREHAYAQHAVGCVSKRDLFILGLGLYWGEGVKASATRVSVVNSDPRIIVTMQRWFVECMDVEFSRLRPTVFINAIHRSRSLEILTYWSTLLGIPQDRFGKMVFLKKRPKKRYENHDTYYGILALQIEKPAGLKYKILGMFGYVAAQTTQRRGSSDG